MIIKNYLSLRISEVTEMESYFWWSQGKNIVDKECCYLMV